MFGWRRPAVASASVLKRCKSAAVGSEPGRSILRATIAVEAFLPHAVDDAHAAAAQLGDDLVIAEGAAGRRRSRRRHRGRPVEDGDGGVAGGG